MPDLHPELAKIQEEILKSREHLFITGKAGTGKSTLLKSLITQLPGNTAVVASTGISALHVGGQTVHSFFRIPPYMIMPNQVQRVRSKIYKNLDTVVIDEISMVRADTVDVMDAFLRKNGSDKSKPFGGVRLICFGDLFQLPPVISHEIEEQLMDLLYDSPYFFDALAWQKSPFDTILLEMVLRQKDADFIRLLDEVRFQTFDQQDLAILNERVDRHFEPEENDFYLTLTATNAQADRINREHLGRIDNRTWNYEAEKSGVFEGNRSLPNDEVLQFKEGAQVMFIRNDTRGRWVNGTLGKILDLDSDGILVELAETGEHVEVEPIEWEMRKYAYNDTKRTIDTETIGTFTQMPLRLAWAMTIHKSQGKTFDRVIIDLGRGAFAPGQTYVALSRCRTLEGIVLRQPVQSRDIQSDPRITHFYQSARGSTQFIR